MLGVTVLQFHSYECYFSSPQYTSKEDFVLFWVKTVLKFRSSTFSNTRNAPRTTKKVIFSEFLNWEQTVINSSNFSRHKEK